MVPTLIAVMKNLKRVHAQQMKIVKPLGSRGSAVRLYMAPHWLVVTSSQETVGPAQRMKPVQLWAWQGTVVQPVSKF